MFPITNEIPEDTSNDNIGISFVFDFKSGQMKIIDGKLQKADTETNIKQWIELLLRTDINKYKVYTQDETEDFGISICSQMQNKNIGRGYFSSELKREIEEQILGHKGIESIENFSVSFERRTIVVTFTTVLTNGTKVLLESEVGN